MSALSDWVDDQREVMIFTGALAVTVGSNAFFRKFSTTKATLAGWVLGAYVGTQAFGVSLSYIVDEEEGIDNWMAASHTMFRNRTVLDNVPVVGSALTIVPNPVGIIEVLWQAGVKIGEYTNPFVGKSFEISDGSW